jgi:hypothetical protein
VVLFGFGFFLVNILLTQTVWLIDNYKSNRYAYLPYVGLFLILAVLVERLLAVAPTWRVRHAATVAAGLLLAAMLGLSALTVVRNSVWQNTITVMSDSIASEPGVAFVHNNRGIARFKQGDYVGAAADFHDTLAIDPDFMLARYYLAQIKHADKDFQGALDDLNAIMPNYDTFAAGFNARPRRRTRCTTSPAGSRTRARPSRWTRSWSTRTNTRAVGELELKDPDVRAEGPEQGDRDVPRTSPTRTQPWQRQGPDGRHPGWVRRSCRRRNRWVSRTRAPRTQQNCTSRLTPAI